MRYKVRIQNWPGGLSTICGGTRGEIKLDRPWQKADVPINQSGCPFEKERGHEEGLQHFEVPGWLVTKNRFTPYESFHVMAIPLICWDMEKLRVLGGEEEIIAALDVISRIITERLGELYVNVHIGAMAGQNVRHLHWHIVQAESNHSDPGVAAFMRDSSLVILEDHNLRIVLGGVRAGQCFIVPTTPAYFIGSEVVGLAQMIFRIICLYADRFLSLQGLPPDYNLSFRFLAGQMDYGIYTPILNHRGGLEELALYRGLPITLPWSHEATAAHLFG